MLLDQELSDTTFFAGPDESLATADVYEVSNDNVINNITYNDAENAANLSAMEEEARGRFEMPALKDLTPPGLNNTSFLSNVKVDSKSATGGLLDKLKSAGAAALKAVGGVQGLAKLTTSAAGPSIMSRIGNGGLTGIPGLSNNGLASLGSVLGGSNLPPAVNSGLNLPIVSNLGTVVNYGGVSNRIAPGQLNNTYQMSALLNSVTGSSTPISIVDRDSSARLMSTLGIGAMTAGVPGTYKTLAPLAGGDRGILSAVASTMTLFAAQSGNANGMRDVVKAAGKPLIATCGKAAMTSLSQCFTKPKTTSAAPAAATQQDFKDITESFDEIDDGWMRDDRYKQDEQGNSVLDYKVVDISLAREGNQAFCSTMTQGAVASTDPDLKFFAMASAFPPSSPEAELRRNFPLTVTSITTNTTPNTTTVPEPPPSSGAVPEDVFASFFGGR